MGEIHDPAVRFILGTCFCIFLLSIVSPSQGLKCYVCTSDQPGCTSNVESSPISYVIDCPGAVACVLYIVEYDFFIPSVFFRSCLYEVDKSCYKRVYSPNKIELDNSEVYEDKKYVSQRSDDSYHNFQNCIWRTRTKELPDSPYTSNDVSHEEHTFSHILFQAALGNSRDWSDYGGPNNTDIAHKRLPLTQDLVCYSCEAEMPEFWKSYLTSGWGGFLPTCGNMETMPTISCKGAYGCAAFWETIEFYQWFEGLGNHHYKTSNRVWRGCWYPGDQKCLRYPKKNGNSGARDLSTFDKRRGPEEENSCRKAYKNGRTSKEVVVWRGAASYDSMDAKISYIDCMHEVRRNIGVHEDLVTSREEKLGGAKDRYFVDVNYYYCGPGDKCNDGHRNPLPPPPPGYSPPSPIPNSRTPKPLLPTTTTPSSKKENNRTVDDKFNPRIPETGQSNCSIIDGGGRGAAPQSRRTSQFSVVVVALLILAFTLLQN